MKRRLISTGMTSMPSIRIASLRIVIGFSQSAQIGTAVTRSYCWYSADWFWYKCVCCSVKCWVLSFLVFLPNSTCLGVVYCPACARSPSRQSNYTEIHWCWEKVTYLSSSILPVLIHTERSTKSPRTFSIAQSWKKAFYGGYGYRMSFVHDRPFGVKDPSLGELGSRTTLKVRTAGQRLTDPASTRRLHHGVRGHATVTGRTHVGGMRRRCPGRPGGGRSTRTIVCRSGRP